MSEHKERQSNNVSEVPTYNVMDSKLPVYSDPSLQNEGSERLGGGSKDEDND